MTNKNMSLKGNVPFLLKPAGKDYLWGGRRLKDVFSKDIDLYPLAETWECSAHPDGVCKAASGEYAGMPLTDVLDRHPEYLGTHPGKACGLPVLVKFIDAKRDLSVQVHPDDRYAREHENGQPGKTEMWYILDATKDAKLVHGFNRDLDKTTVKKALETGEIEKYLRKVPVKKDDIFFIEPGTVHALGAGTLVAEVQENSNLTYRLYDYNRTDKKGEKRELHIDKALDVMRLGGCREPRQPMRVLRFRRGYATELLCRCKYFQVERMLLNTERHREMASFTTGGNSFQIFLCISGCGVIYWNGGMVNFHKGDCLFVPAESVPLKLHGQAQFLKIEC